ncbi:MAG: hypothetical protein KF805_03120 [Phycisphaeraceae bacterium]|nr:hypothetical protein [Phycisphaeraceae bacterium]
MSGVPHSTPRKTTKDSVQKSPVKMAAPTNPILSETLSGAFSPLAPASSSERVSDSTAISTTPSIEPIPATDLEKARARFQEAGLAFPTMPPNLAARPKEQEPWVFSTRTLNVWPYDLDHYVREPRSEDYAILSHSGHGGNSYAIHYYLQFGGLAMFLQLAWGGCYMDNDQASASIARCFSLADKIVGATHPKLLPGTSQCLTIVASDFHGSYWVRPGDNLSMHEHQIELRPMQALAQAHDWLTG